MEMALSRVANGSLGWGITHSVVVLKGEPIIKDHFDPSVSIRCLRSRPNDPGLIWALRRLIREERPTVIHARNLGAWPDIAVARLMSWPIVPLVFSFHGVAVPGPQPLRWRLACRALVYLSSFVFTVSQGAKDYLEDMGLPGSRISVIPNGVDTDRFSPVLKSPQQEGWVLGTVGSLTPVKNQALLIRACHRLIQEGFKVCVKIAGEGPERPALEQLVHSLGVSEQIRLVGHVDDTPAFLRELDVFVLPSDSEAHPNALSEAMACGLPCVATRVGGVPEILDHGHAGMLVDRCSEGGLVDGIRTLLLDSSARQDLSAAARKRTCERYSMAIMLEKYRKLYSCLSGPTFRTSRA